mmetsp:Transcript_14087/g.42604  ORF Transcript_14087/g.42604 Transcript_14087/m.42604 type:complete len:334 (+) Transcript_14087:81-1082(+)
MIVVCLALRFTLTILYLGSCVVFAFMRSAGRPENTIGTTTRRSIVGAWCVAHFVRGACAGAEVFVCSGLLCPGVWICRLLRCLGDLPFWSAYALFVLFLGHLHRAANFGTSRLFPAWIVLNVVVYAAVLLLSIAAIASSSQDVAGELVQFVLSVAYFSLLCLLAYHSFWLHRAIQPSLSLLPAGLLRVLTRLTTFVACLLAFQAASFLLTATGLSYALSHYGCGAICVADFATSVGLELVPSYVAMFYLRAFKYELFGFFPAHHRDGRGLAPGAERSPPALYNAIYGSTTSPPLLSLQQPQPPKEDAPPSSSSHSTARASIQLSRQALLHNHR